MLDPLDLARKAVELGEPEARPWFPVLGRQEILARPPKPWIVQGLLGTNDLAMVFGPPGGGKTFVVLDWLFALESGKPVAGRFPVSGATRGLYVASEGFGGVPGRFVAAAVRRQAGQEEWPGLVLGGPNLTCGDEVTGFIECAREAGSFGVVVFDTLHGHTTGADENSAQDGGVIVAALRRVARELDCAVVVVHHEAKHGGERGTSAFRGAFDCLVRVAAGAVTCSKLKDAEPFEDVAFQVEGVVATENGREYESAAVAWLGAARRETVRNRVLAELATLAGDPFADRGIAAEEVAKRIGEKADTVKRELNKMHGSGLIERFGTGKKGDPHTFGPLGARP